MTRTSEVNERMCRAEKDSSAYNVVYDATLDEQLLTNSECLLLPLDSSMH